MAQARGMIHEADSGIKPGVWQGPAAASAMTAPFGAGQMHSQLPLCSKEESTDLCGSPGFRCYFKGLFSCAGPGSLCRAARGSGGGGAVAMAPCFCRLDVRSL